MPKKRPGQKIGVECPVCHEGKLLVRIKHTEYDDGAIGGRGTPDTNVVHELVCSNCCLKFAAADEGQSIWPIIENKLGGFTQPDTKPTTCPVCENDSLKEGRTHHASAGDEWRPFGGRDSQHHKRTIFLYCNDCLTPVYVTKEPSI